jgi:hypothetical protein
MLDFNDSDVEQIKAKQSELFKFAVETKFKELQAQFLVRYNASEMKKFYLLDELKECKNIILGKIPDDAIVHFDIWGISLDNQYISDVQYYINRNIKSGIIDGWGFVHSPHCKFQNNSISDPRVYGRFVWEYNNWLMKFAKSEGLKSNSNNKKLQQRQIDKQTRIWFIVGLFFASGEIERILERQKTGSGINFTSIARELGNISYRPFLSESHSNRHEGNKNIFSNHEKLKLIYDYCISNNIKMVDSFLSFIK